MEGFKSACRLYLSHTCKHSLLQCLLACDGESQGTRLEGVKSYGPAQRRSLLTPHTPTSTSSLVLVS